MKPVNLNQLRKQRERAAAKAKADENAIRFGRTKADRTRDAAQIAQADARLSHAKLEDD